MEAIEKAKELYFKFHNHSFANWDEVKGWDKSSDIYNTKQCAIIAADEIIFEIRKGVNSDWDHVRRNSEDTISYWEEVKEEIKKL